MTQILWPCFPFRAALTCRERMKLYHFVILILVALVLCAAQFYFDSMDAPPPRPVKQVRVVYQDPQTEETFVEDDDHE